MSSEPNVYMVVNSRDDVSSRANNPPNYQTTYYAAQNQNLVQGQIQKLSVNEVNFPYDIPNVMTGNDPTRPLNSFQMLSTNGPPTAQLVIVIPPGFYTGTELAAAIQSQIAAESLLQAPPINLVDQPLINYDTANNLFSFSIPSTLVNNAYSEWGLISWYTYPTQNNISNLPYDKDLLTIMGYKPYQGYYIQPPPLPPYGGFVYGGFNVANPLISASAPLTFTQYIDICSPELCQFQELNTGNTTNFSRRTDIICRLYIANNTATTNGVEGTRPVVINRQYTNERMMRWTAGSSIGNLTIQLYDDLGRPLITQWTPRPFQITFNVYELERELPKTSNVF